MSLEVAVVLIYFTVLSRLARMPRPARRKRSRRLHAMLAAAPVLFARTFSWCHMLNIPYRIDAVQLSEGSSFWFLLPLVTPPEPEQALIASDLVKRPISTRMSLHSIASGRSVTAHSPDTVDSAVSTVALDSDALRDDIKFVKLLSGSESTRSVHVCPALPARTSFTSKTSRVHPEPAVLTQLPVEAAVEAPRAAAPAVPADIHVVFCDDDESKCRIGKRMVERLGYKVTVVRDGDEALQVLIDCGQLSTGALGEDFCCARS